MPTKGLLILALATLLPLAATAQRVFPFAPGATITAQQWEVVDIAFTGPAELPAPFEVEAAATFEGPGEQRLKVPLFYNGGREFVLRFCPPQTGAWKFRTSSTVRELDGRTGSITADAAPSGRHGPLGIAPGSPRRLAYADGTPAFPIAFECDWLFALDATNAAGIPKTRTLVNYIADHGFNQVVMNVYAYDLAWQKGPKQNPEYDYSRPPYCPFGGDNAKPDFSTLNVAFFRHLDRVLAALDERNVSSHLMIYVWNKKVNWPPSRSPEDNRYFDYVVKRYQAFPNLVWDISKEALGYGHNDASYITDRIQRLRSLDAFRRLVSVHDYGYCSANPKQVDFISIQDWTSELYAAMRKVCADHPDKPVLNIEHGGYEQGPYHVFTGDYLSPEACLERAYQCVFAGAFPTYYWQDTSWSVVVPNPDALPPAERPRTDYYSHLRELLNQHGVSTLAPPEKGYSSSGMCLTDGQTRFVFYVPKENSAIHVNLPAKTGRKFNVEWFNPFTGETLDRGEKPVQPYQEISLPGWNHFAILIATLLPE